MHRLIGRLRTRLRVGAILLAAAVTVASTAVPAYAIGGTVGSISGTVSDAKTKLPIAGVIVSASSPVQDSKATTDSKGFYSINGLPANTQTISF